MKKDIHVTHRVSQKKWAVIGEGDDRASSLHDTQGEALKAGREIAENNKVELVIHDRHNKIRDTDSFGNDPPSIKDKKH